MSRFADVPAHASDTVKLAGLLERVLQNLLTSQQAMMVCLEEKRTAVRGADAQALAAVCAQEKTIVQRLEELDMQRNEVVRRLAPMVGIKAGSPVRMRALAEAIGGDVGERLLAITQELREVVVRVQKESSILKTAMESLSRHLGGIVETVNGAMSRARVYGRKGRIAVGMQLTATLDVKS